MGMVRERAGGDDSIIVALGGNVAPPGLGIGEVLEAALDAFPSIGLTVLRRSRLWRSAAWPNAADPAFLNLVALVDTELDAEATLQVLHGLEAAAGRMRGRPNGPRTLDLDLIGHGRTVRPASPVLPHPRAAERLFVMGPLAEIAPHWRHPVTGVRASDLAAAATVGRDAAPLESTGRGLQRAAASLI